MKLQTALEKLEFFAYHGLYPEEKMNGANFLVDVWIDEEFDEAKDMSSLENLINYEDIFKLIQEEMNIRRDFIEDLGKTILERILLHLSDRDVLVTIKITKPNPGGRFGSGAASITLQG
jgi:dihydroneopterin aldolase